MEGNLTSIEKDQRFFNRLVFIIQISIAFYAASFFYFEARLCALIYTLCILVFTPLIVLFDRRKLPTAARFTLMAEGLLAIYVTPLGVRQPLNAELYYFLAILLPLLAFDSRRTRLTVIAQLLSPLTWALQLISPMPELSSYWIPETFPNQLFQIVNALGTAGILAVIIRMHTNSISRFQKQLKSTNERLQEVQWIAKLGGWEYHANSKRLFWSDELFALFGLRQGKNEVDLELMSSIIDPRDRRAWTQAFTQSLEDGRPFTLRFRTNHEGREIWLEARAHGRFDDENKLDGLIGTFQDVTSIVKAETDLRHRQSLLEAILQNTPSMIFVKEYKKGLTFSLLNRAGEEILKTNESAVLDMTSHEVMPSEQATRWDELERETIASKKIKVSEMEELHLPDQQKKLKTYRVPTFDESGKPELLIGICHDITEEVEAKAGLALERIKTVQISKLATLGEMSAGMAHEINNPLTTIELVTNQLDRTLPDSAGIKEKLAMIERSVRRISKVVRGIKRFSRTTPKADLQLHSLRAIAAEAVFMAEIKARLHNTTITLEAEVTGEVLCDEIEIEQVIINLINNSIDAVKGHTEKWVKVELTEDAETVVLRVSDSGPGISKETAAKIFQPFFTTKESGEGTGLGLSICKSILEEHGASIAFMASSPHTCFEVRFTRQQALRIAG